MILVHCRPLPETRTRNSSAAWLAECEVDGRRFEAKSRHGAPNELARRLVEAGVPDAPIEIHYDGLVCGDDYDGRLTTIRMAGQVGRLGCFNQGSPRDRGGTLIVGQAHHRPPGQAVHEVMQRGLHPGGCGGPFRV